jgi:hypothetical protein
VRFSLRVSNVAAVLLTVFTFTQISPAQAQQNPTTQHQFWIVITSGESFMDAVQQAARAPDGGQVVTTLKEMVRRAEAGHTVYVPRVGRHGVVNVTATVSQLQATLAAVHSLSPESLVPQKFDVEGDGCNPYIYNRVSYFASWCDMNYNIESEICNPEGCTDINQINATLKVDPGSTGGSRVSYTSQYYHEGPSYFTDIHFEWWTLCYRNALTCGSDNTKNFSGAGNGTFTTNSGSINLHNDQITIAVAYLALFTPNGQTYSIGFKTPMGYCLPESSDSNQCLFSS